jgi:hypothetical protein
MQNTTQYVLLAPDGSQRVMAQPNFPVQTSPYTYSPQFSPQPYAPQPYAPSPESYFYSAPPLTGSLQAGEVPR